MIKRNWNLNISLLIAQIATSEEIISSSQCKINNAITVEKGSDDSDVETDDETVSFDGMVSPKHRWIISLDIMERHLQDVSVCRWCGQGPGQGLRIVESFAVFTFSWFIKKLFELCYIF